MKTLAVILMTLTLTACASQTMQADHGVSTSNNVAVQTVDPAAESSGTTATGMEGISASDAMKAYKEADNRNRGERLVQDLVD